MPTFKIVTDTITGKPAIKVTPTADDLFVWDTTGSKVENGLLICGQTKTTAGKMVKLGLLIYGRPELQEMIVELQRLQVEEEEAKTARQAKIDAIPGLVILKAAYSAVTSTHDAYEIKSEYGYQAREAAAWHKAEDEATKVRVQYPIAASYLMAEGWTYAANDAKATSGKRGMERIINGENHEAVVAEMNAEWTAAARRAAENS